MNIKTIKLLLSIGVMVFAGITPILFRIYVMDKLNDFEYAILTFKQRYQFAFSLFIMLIVEIILATIFNIYYFNALPSLALGLEAGMILLLSLTWFLSITLRRKIYVTIDDEGTYEVIHQTLDGRILLKSTNNTNHYKFISKEELYKHVLTVKRRKNRNKD